jgi:hypothetical protein
MNNSVLFQLLCVSHLQVLTYCDPDIECAVLRWRRTCTSSRSTGRWSCLYSGQWTWGVCHCGGQFSALNRPGCITASRPAGGNSHSHRQSCGDEPVTGEPAYKAEGEADGNLPAHQHWVKLLLSMSKNRWGTNSLVFLCWFHSWGTIALVFYRSWGVNTLFFYCLFHSWGTKTFTFLLLFHSLGTNTFVFLCLF